MTFPLKLESALPVRVDHGPLVDSHGVLLDVGAARKFCPISEPVDGLLALCEVDEGEWGDAILEDVARHLDGPEWLPAYGFSLGARVLPGLLGRHRQRTGTSRRPILPPALARDRDAANTMA